MVWHQGKEHTLCNQTERPRGPAPPLTCCVTLDKSPHGIFNTKTVIIFTPEHREDSSSLTDRNLLARCLVS